VNRYFQCITKNITPDKVVNIWYIEHLSVL